MHPDDVQALAGTLEALTYLAEDDQYWEDTREKVTC